VVLVLTKIVLYGIFTAPPPCVFGKWLRSDKISREKFFANVPISVITAFNDCSISSLTFQKILRDKLSAEGAARVKLNGARPYSTFNFIDKVFPAIA